MNVAAFIPGDRVAHPDFGAGVVLELPRNATASFIVRLVESLLQQPEVVAKIEGRLAIVAAGRVRLRPP